MAAEITISIILATVGLVALSVVVYWTVGTRRLQQQTNEKIKRLVDERTLDQVKVGTTDDRLCWDDPAEDMAISTADGVVHVPRTGAWFHSDRFDLIDKVAKALYDVTRDPDRITPWDMAVVAVDASKDQIRADEKARLVAEGWVAPEAHEAVVATAKARVEHWLRKSLHEQVDALPVLVAGSNYTYVRRDDVLDLILDLKGKGDGNA